MCLKTKGSKARSHLPGPMRKIMHLSKCIFCDKYCFIAPDVLIVTDISRINAPDLINTKGFFVCSCVSICQWYVSPGGLSWGGLRILNMGTLVSVSGHHGLHGDLVPVDEIYGCLITKLFSVFWRGWGNAPVIARWRPPGDTPYLIYELHLISRYVHTMCCICNNAFACSFFFWSHICHTWERDAWII